jgi:Fe-S-cluster containining protein
MEIAAMFFWEAAGIAEPDHPCCWYDPATRRCRNYDYRPEACRDFEPGTEECGEARARHRIDP